MLRNSEFRRFTAWFLVLAVVASVAGFVMNPPAGFLALALSSALGAAFFLFTKARYRSLARISEQIDLVLHNADLLDIAEVDEGELSILQSEIKKMTLRIREQNDMLKKDKQYLADSLADIAHQLRTPLTSANLVLSLLAKNPGAQERQSYIRELDRLLVHMEWLITSLLKLSRLDAGVAAFQNTPVSVQELVGAALGPLLIPMELREIDWEMDVPEDAVIQGDPAWLSEALQNILKNCVENTPGRGAIRITCVDTVLHTEITVHDSGAGFDKEDIPLLFDRFYRGKNTGATGYGIGLALSKTIISRQGGFVTAKNHPQGGALFVVRFPKVTNLSPESHR